VLSRIENIVININRLVTMMFDTKTIFTELVEIMINARGWMV